jgi:hypothetical protein
MEFFLQGSLIFVFNGEKNNQHFVDEEGEQMNRIACTRADVEIKIMAGLLLIFMQWRLIFNSCCEK